MKTTGSMRLRGQGMGGRLKPISLAVAAALYGAAVVPGTAHAAGAAAASASSPIPVLQEVVVSARLVRENLQDVPESLQVFTSKDIRNLDLTRFNAIATKSPSISFVSDGPTEQSFYMRGVSDGSSANAANTSTTGYFLDDASLSFYGTFPDLHLYDVKRIEVLDGPQGTLYGAGSMSGALRIITNKPDLYKFGGGVDVNFGQIHNGGQNNTDEAFVNIPLIDGRTALRLSVFKVSKGGFIDNVLATRQWVNGVVSNNAQWAHKNYNTEREYGGRAALDQKISENWNAVLTFNYQRQTTAGSWAQDPAHYGLRKVAHFGPENIAATFSSYDLHVNGDVGIGDLVYAGTYWNYADHYTTEYSQYVQYSPFSSYYQDSPQLMQSLTCLTGPTIQGGTDPYSGCQAPTMFYKYDAWTRRWSNEVRLQSKPGGRLHWLVGAYWEKTRQNYNYFYDMPGMQPSGEAYQSALSYYSAYYTGTAAPLPHEWYSSISRFDYLQTAEFADLNYDLTKRWNIDVGVRYFRSNFSGSNLWAAYFYQPKTPSGAYTGSSHKITTKASLSYKPTKNLMLYATFSQGFRDGGVNQDSTTCYNRGVPRTYNPDTLDNYEVGWKSGLLHGRMIWNGAFYYMPWKDFQAPIYDLSLCPNTFSANFGNARVYGAETNIDVQIVRGLTLQAAASYNDSKLTSVKPNFTGVLTSMIVPNERLPFVPYFTYSANVRYTRPVSNSLNAFVQYDIAHKGDMWSDLRALPNPALGKKGTARVLQPAYTLSDVSLGVESADNRWTLEAYVDNLWDTNAVIFVNTGNYDNRQTTNEPRVVGVRASYRF